MSSVIIKEEAVDSWGTDSAMSVVETKEVNDRYNSRRGEGLHLLLTANVDFAKTSTSFSITQDRYTEDFANAAIFFPFAFALRGRRNFKFNL